MVNDRATGIMATVTVLIIVALLALAAAPAPAAPPAQVATETLGTFVDVDVTAGATADQRTFDTSNITVLGGLFTTSGTGTFAVNLIWKDASGNTIATESDVTEAVGDGVGFRAFVRAPRVTVQFEETGSANPVTVDFGALIGQAVSGALS